MKKWLTVMGCVGFVVGAQAADISAKLQRAMQSDIRDESEIKRDANRKPMETLAFFGLQDDMKVVELIPGGGWYTKLLAPILRDNGDFSIAYGTERAEKAIKGQEGFDKVNILAPTSKVYRPENAAFYALDNPDLATSDVDMVFTFRNYHNFGPEGRAAMNEAVYKALKPGGIYAVVDHTRRHMQPNNDFNGRRVDPVLAIKEIQDAGFELVDYSDLHYRPVDELIYEVGHKDVTGHTDRWTLKFRKK
ncbi:class I SAM-dependent methyltransferase [Neptunicella sp. SCSIO 80796]|uniref:class I SAM-dependent methyltransferase n=1 Tax=Neptunicella plasticusilytica TaxID=3117012 RepID=UPI003A4D225A